MLMRIFTAGIVAIALTGVVAMAADSPMKLFKVVTVKDETVIGVSAEELRSFGPSTDLENLASRLATVGQLPVWQYAVRKGSDGQLQQAPNQRIVIFSSGTARIEPYAMPLPIILPQQ